MGYHNRQRRILMNEGETQVPKRLEADALLPHLTPKPPAAPPVLSIRCTADVASSVPPEFRMASAPACGLPLKLNPNKREGEGKLSTIRC
jgi:hypothetical protein